MPWRLLRIAKPRPLTTAAFSTILVVPFRGVTRDTILRADTSIEKLATLKPAFDKISGLKAR
jgi:acetyl-CoA acetyltransferase